MIYLFMGESSFLLDLAEYFLAKSSKSLIVDNFGERRLLSEKFDTLSDSIYDFDDYLNDVVDLEDVAVQSERNENIFVVAASIKKDKAKKNEENIGKFINDEYLTNFDDIFIISKENINFGTDFFDYIISDTYLEDDSIYFVIDRPKFQVGMKNILGFWDYPVSKIYDNLLNKSFVKKESVLERIRGIFIKWFLKIS